MISGSTLILTKKGWKPISSLKEGMIVASPRGYYCKIKKIHRVKNFKNKLFIIRKGAIGPDKPAGPIYITGNHRYYHHRLGKPKVPSKTIKAIYNPSKPVTLYNIELKNHNDTLFANKMVIDSFR
jgi:hypothetical protein